MKTHELGFGIYYIFPVFYVDLGEVWKLNTRKRTIINLSGIYIQLIIGLLIYGVSVFFRNNPLLLNLFYFNSIVIATNLNPFFKFDGFWVVSDLLNENDLVKKSNKIIKTMLVFRNPKEKHTLVLYSILKFCFLAWIVFNVGKGIYGNITKLVKSETIKGSDIYLPILLLIYIFYIITITVLKRKYELAERERNL